MTGGIFSNFSVPLQLQPLATTFNLELNLDSPFIQLVEAVLKAQEEHHAFSNLRQAKGAIGESLSHTFFNAILPNFYFLNGQAQDVDTSSEKLAYKAAREFFSNNQECNYVIADRPFGGGAPYSVDLVQMLITRQDVENWEAKNQRTANYFVFEAKTDTSTLSKKQRKFSYVIEKASQMSNNRPYRDRRQVGNELLNAVQDNRVIYIMFHLDTQSGRAIAKSIQPEVSGNS